MERHRIEQINEMLDVIAQRTEIVKKQEVEMYKRLVERLASYSTKCEQCEALLHDIEQETIQVADKQESLSKKDWKEYAKSFATIRTHLLKEHQLVPENYYQMTYMSIGIGLGVMVGLTMLDNIGVGIGIGIALGVAVGMVKDRDAKKKGQTL